ncbi:c-type cytochrome, partial [Fodinibius sp.]|uniref:c-type cytochrome n=1 Tax=Fodinibius sp. TaxID=1872440 RepID=UPI00356A9BF6
AYYTLKEIPEGPTLSLSEVSRKNTSPVDPSAGKQPGQEEAKGGDGDGAPSFEQIKPLLSQYTCTSCHQTDERQVGPPFAEIARRNYSNEEMVELMYNPDLSNWPDYATAMPPMTIVPEEEALKIADWINSLDE